jgi:hypothetical protein
MNSSTIPNDQNRVQSVWNRSPETSNHETPPTFWLSLHSTVRQRQVPRQSQTSSTPTISCFRGGEGGGGRGGGERGRGGEREERRERGGGGDTTATTPDWPLSDVGETKTGKRKVREKWEEGEERKREKNHKKTVDGLHTKCQSDSHHRIHFSLWLCGCSVFFLMWHISEYDISQLNDRQNSHTNYSLEWGMVWKKKKSKKWEEMHTKREREICRKMLQENAGKCWMMWFGFGEADKTTTTTDNRSIHNANY